MRLIDANAIPYNYTNERGVPMTREIDIQNMPTIEKRKTGKWEEREVSSENVIDAWQSARCSVCGKYHTTPHLYYFKGYNFCPNCGADMRGE